MKKSNQYFLLFFISIALISCGPSSERSESEQTEESAETETTQEVDQLTYQDVVAMVYDDQGEGIEWHGEEMPNDLTQFLVITEGNVCGEGDCGKRLSLINTSDRSITTIIRGDYDIEGDQGYIPRKYVVSASDTLMIGCSHLCYGGKGYSFPRTIVASTYTEME
ncbi:hypothetical protein [Ekhidna sp. To15]|uniref:hypothetical protein n=1 Tax=Ekhidna sp. To15 TaxID=3395267 RepID=UPI003F51E5A4